MKFIVLIMVFFWACSQEKNKVVERPIPGGPINVPPPNVPSNPDYINLDIMEDAVLLDLNTLSDVERVNARYFNSCNEYNQGKRDQQAYIAAANKAINSISTESVLENVKAIAPGNCLMRIDLRDYGLTRSEWADITTVLVDRLGRVVRGKFLLIPAVSDSARGQQIQFLTQAVLPIVDTSDFTTTTLGADALTAENGLYYKLIEQPVFLADFFRDIGADIQRQADDEELLLAGFSQSQIALGKSRQVMVAEADEFFVMTTYDSALDDGVDHFVTPFTIEVAQAQGLKRSNKIFVESAQEHIYFLPNGMMAYRLNGNGLVNGGAFEFVAPNNVVINTLASARQLDPTVNIGSCMGCHFEPVIRFNDQLRRHIAQNSAFNALEKELGEVFYDAVSMEATLTVINQEHQDALRKLGVVGAVDPVHDKLVFPFRKEQSADEVCGRLMIPTDVCLQRIRGSALSSQVVGNLLNGGTVSLAILSQNFQQLIIDTQAFRDGSL